MSLRRTPFFELHLASGGRMVPFAGFEMPVQYSGVGPEHLQVRKSVGLFDVSHMGEVRVRGPAAEAALNRLLSNDVTKCEIGAAQYHTMCNPDGGVVDDLFIYRVAADEFFVCVNAANREKDFNWMVAHNEFGAEAVFTDEGDDWAQLAIQGRDAVKVVQALTDQPVTTLGPRRFLHGSFAGVAGCILARTGYTGEDGFEVFIPAKHAAPTWNAVLEAGKPFGILPIGLGARDTLRLEVRNCLYGHELTDTTTPTQAGLGWVVKLDKPAGFVGRDAIAARKATDSDKLVGLVVEGGRIARDGMAVHYDGGQVGYVTSGTKTPSLSAPVALAYVPADIAKAGTRVTIDVRGKETEAVIVSGPFYKRDY